MQHDPPPELTLSHLPFQVLGATTHPRRHGWAGRISWDELVGAGVRRAGHRYLRLQFHSPTSFRGGHHNLPLPLPHLVFGSLAAQWRACAPAPLAGWIDALVPAGLSHAACAAAVERNVRIARHRIETRLLAFPEYRRVGFVGDVDFELAPGIPPAAAAAAQTLAFLAQYAGVGDKTTMGMGQVRLSPDEDSRATWT
nr:CRISPR system precrRNA processing endoribonuclease RAMP protein Cas6 [Thiococcus pfennigii]